MAEDLTIEVPKCACCGKTFATQASTTFAAFALGDNDMCWYLLRGHCKPDIEDEDDH